MNINVRKAVINDKDFLITSVIEAEKSGSDIISYCALLSISEQTFREILSNILDEEIGGQELCIGNFLIAEIDGEPAAALSAWIEKEDGMASSMIKSNLLMYLMDREILLNAAPSLSLMNEINIDREAGALQIECVYTVEKYRGYGLSGQLIEEQIRRKQESGKSFEKVQVILLKSNQAAKRAYEKSGFSLLEEKQCANKDILKLLPCDIKILLERKLNGK